MNPQQPDQILATVTAAIRGLELPHLRSLLLTGLFTPIRERRTYYTDHGEAQGDVWRFFTIPRRNTVSLAYSDEGYGLSGRRWGLVFIGSDIYGDFDAWYDSLESLVGENSLYFEDG